MIKAFKWAALANAGCILVSISSGCSAFAEPEIIASTPVMQTIPVDVVPVHHLGDYYSVEDVSVNGQMGGDAGRGGGGGSYVCCVLLPTVWRPGLVAKLRWRVRDWRKENKEETKLGIYKSIIDEGEYVATVPVEYYSEVGTLYLHFFRDAKARVVTSRHGAFGKGHPISENVQEQELATSGTLVVQKEHVGPIEASGK